MTLDGSHRTKRAASLPILGVVTGAVLLGLMSSTATADPAEDAVAKLNDLSRQAEQAAEAMHSAQLDLNQKLDVQAAADRQLTQSQADVSVAQTQLGSFQTSVDRVAAARKLEGAHSRIISYVMTLRGPEPVGAQHHPIDRAHYVEKQIRPVAEQVLDALSLDFDTVVQAPGRQLSLL